MTVKTVPGTGFVYNDGRLHTSTNYGNKQLITFVNETESENDFKFESDFEIEFES